MRYWIAFVLLIQCILQVSAQESIPVRSWKVASQSDSLPQMVDNSVSTYFPPVFMQIGGSCAQASMVGYVFTYEFNSFLNRSADIASNRFSYLYSWNFINDGIDQGSLAFDAVTISYHNGMMTEADFPQQTSAYSFRWASGYEKYFRSMHYRVASFDNIEVASEEGIEALKQYLFNGGVEGGHGKVVSFSSGASGWTFNDDYSGPSLSGYHSLLTGLPTGGAHAMTIVGYDNKVECTVSGKISYGAFIVVNSHGSSRHDNGHYYLPYVFFFEEQEDKYLLSSSVTGMSVAYVNPTLVFKVGIDFSSRNDLSFRMGVADMPYATIPQKEVVVSIARNQGGDYPMQGSGASSEIEFGFNASELSAYVSTMKEPKFFIAVNRGNIGRVYGSGMMKSFAVYDYRLGEDHPVVYEADIQDGSLALGNNYFSVATTSVKTISASPIDWLKDGKPKNSPFVVKTAKGNYAKLNFIDYDSSNGRLTIQYVYAPDGDTFLGN